MHQTLVDTFRISQLEETQQLSSREMLSSSGLRSECTTGHDLFDIGAWKQMLVLRVTHPRSNSMTRVKICRSAVDRAGFYSDAAVVAVQKKWQFLLWFSCGCLRGGRGALGPPVSPSRG